MVLAVSAAFGLLAARANAIQAEDVLPPPNGSAPASNGQPAFGLDECIHMALEKQPALAAQQASLASANTAARGLNSLIKLPLLASDLPIRRKQACLGIAIAQAGLDQAQWETIYSVTRLYFTVLYARSQEKVVKDQITRLQFYLDRVKEVVKSGTTREYTEITVDKIAIHLRLAETKLVEAQEGEKRATAALGEAIGLDPGTCFSVPPGDLPDPHVTLCCGDVVAMALARRGELVQVVTASQVVDLEVAAQKKLFWPVARTFASGSDIHARPVPQGHANREYWPGATGLEMPTFFAGPKWARVERARELSARAGAVVDKTRNLIALEAEDAFLKCQEAANKIPSARQAVEAGDRVIGAARKGLGEVGGTRVEDILTSEGDFARAQATLNEARYQKAIELAAVQRVTAGGFDPGFAIAVAVHP
jgi:outer membrane protein TolC